MSRAESDAVNALFLRRYREAGTPADRAIAIMSGCLAELRDARKAGRVAEFVAACGTPPAEDPAPPAERPKVEPRHLPVTMAERMARFGLAVPAEPDAPAEPEPDEARYFGV